MKELALTLTFPSATPMIINGPPGFGTGAGNFSNLGNLVSSFFRLGILLGGVVMVFWLGWGVFQYIFAGGSKERLAFARKRIIFALVGFIILIVAFSIQLYVKQTIYAPQLQNGGNTVKDITTPGP